MFFLKEKQPAGQNRESVALAPECVFYQQTTDVEIKRMEITDVEVKGVEIPKDDFSPKVNFKFQ